MEKKFEPLLVKFTGRYSSILIIVALSFFISVSAMATANTFSGGGQMITEQELENVIGALRSNGHTLFGNAITMSDVRYQILAGDTFTFFAPLDANLFSLDMSTGADDYVQNLRYHVAPRRLSISDLRNLSSLGRSHLIETLLPHHGLLIRNQNRPPNDTIPGLLTVGGVRISHPDLYLGPRFVVHGLGGILEAVSEHSESFSGQFGFVPPSRQVASSRAPPEIIIKSRRSKKRGKRHHNHSHRKRNPHVFSCKHVISGKFSYLPATYDL